ncbi:MAG: PrsW family intramembrane metalloprotease [Thermoproteales archaeon]|nr:PrsW family intramembrane metalloprotease [Thermoproteales archaeon]
MQPVKYCPRCGTPNNQHALFCRKCGYPLNNKKCPSCGKDIPFTYQRCPYCGYVFPTVTPSKARYTITKSYPFVQQKVAPSGNIIRDITLIYKMAFNKRPPIYAPSDKVYQYLPYDILVRSSKYLHYALLTFLIGVLLAFTVTITEKRIMFFLPSFFATILPILFYIYWMKKVDRYEPEPFWILALAFGWGAASTLIAILLNDILIPFFGGWAGAAAFVEEPSKILGIYLLAINPRLGKELNDHLDGLLYGALAGLGFGFVENILYISRGLAMGNWLIIALRAITVGMHMFCTGLIGWWIGYLKVTNKQINIYNILPALLFAIFIHMTWNTVTYLGLLGLLIILVLGPFLILKAHKMAIEALIDEYYWGFTHGYAPIEKYR